MVSRKKMWRSKMRQTRSSKRLVLSAALAVFASLSLSTAAKADSEAGFIMIGQGSESGGAAGTGAESDTLWTGSTSESGGPQATGAESDSGGALQSESSSESGGATNSGAESSAIFGGGDNSVGRYVQYYGR
jgi:hypothetical protein